jgi:mutual gliding-motility protein MglA
MVLFNYSTRELTAKVVYYGPGICGKTTNLQFIHENLPGEVRGKMLSLATKTDRTLFFDFLPIDLGEIRGMKTRVQLYTVPGQVFYNETRKLVLKGVDGIVFVADSQETMSGANVESFKNLEENLRGHGMKLSEMPHVIQFNKRDLPKLSSIEDMNSTLNKYNAPFYESVATTGIGVQDTLKAIVKLVLLNLTRKYESKSAGESTAASVPVAAAAPVTAVAAMAAVGAGSTAPPARASVSVASTAEAARPAAEAPRPQAPPPPVHAPASSKRSKSAGKSKAAAAPPPIQTMVPFNEDEIDGLVGEVEDVDMPATQAPPAQETWMGEPEPTHPVQLAPSAPSKPAPSKPAAAKKAGEFEVDRGYDPEWELPMPAAEDMLTPEPVAAMAELGPIEPFPVPVEDVAIGDDAEPDMLLTEIATDDDLFSDPSLEIARLAEGQGREIVVPVMLGEGKNAKRYKLAIRLRLDRVG